MNNKIIVAPSGGLNTKINPVSMSESDAVVFENCVVEEGNVHRRDGFVCKSFVLNSAGTQLGNPSLAPVEIDSTKGKINAVFYLTQWKESDGSGFVDKYGANVFFEEDGVYVMKHIYHKLNLMLSRETDYIKFGNTWVYTPKGMTDVPFRYEYTAATDEHFFTPLVLTHEEAEDNFNAARLIKSESHSKRLFFLEHKSMRIWYVDQVNAFQGEVNYFDVSYLAKKGTRLVELVEWTRAGADVINTMLVAFSDEGEVFMWTGTDPESEDWTLSGVYYIPPLLGDNSVIQVGSDILVMTEKGLYSADSFTAQDSRAKLEAFSDKIETTISKMSRQMEDSRTEGSLYFSNDRKEVWWIYGWSQVGAGADRLPFVAETAYLKYSAASSADSYQHDVLLCDYLTVPQDVVFDQIQFINYPISCGYMSGAGYGYDIHIGIIRKDTEEYVTFAQYTPTTSDKNSLEEVVVNLSDEDKSLLADPAVWDGKIWAWLPKWYYFQTNVILGKTGVQSSTIISWHEKDITKPHKKTALHDEYPYDTKALVYHLDTGSWSEYSDCTFNPSVETAVFNRCLSLCDFDSKFWGIFRSLPTGQGADAVSLAVLEKGALEYGNRIKFSVQQAYSDLGNPCIKKVSHVIITAVIPYVSTSVLVSFYADFKYQSSAVVVPQFYYRDPITSKIPAQQILVDCPCSPCTFFSIRLDVTSGVETPNVFEWVSTQVFFEEGVV